MLLGHSVETHQWPATLAATFKFVCLGPALALWLLMTVRDFAVGDRVWYSLSHFSRISPGRPRK
jgi:hypothetical protein